MEIKAKEIEIKIFGNEILWTNINWKFNICHKKKFTANI